MKQTPVSGTLGNAVSTTFRSGTLQSLKTWVVVVVVVVLRRGVSGGADEAVCRGDDVGDEAGDETAEEGVVSSKRRLRRAAERVCGRRGVNAAAAEDEEEDDDDEGNIRKKNGKEKSGNLHRGSFGAQAERDRAQAARLWDAAFGRHALLSAALCRRRVCRSGAGPLCAQFAAICLARCGPRPRLRPLFRLTELRKKMIHFYSPSPSSSPTTTTAPQLLPDRRQPQKPTK